MNEKAKALIDLLCTLGSLSQSDYRFLIDNYTDDDLFNYASKKALQLKQKIYGNDIYIRGLIEISNICKNDCYYCGIRKSNSHCQRYRMNIEDIMRCCSVGYNLGIRTFVLQGGEDVFFSDKVISQIIQSIKNKYPDCVITLSLGEREKSSYRFLYDCGARRYLLRHETANKTHYEKLHPADMSFENRIACLKALKAIGYQTGCGFMVGTPFQTSSELATDLKFIESFRPEMIGIGPFIAQKNTPFFLEKNGSVNLTLFLMSILRLIMPPALIPATTSLETLDSNGFKKGLLCGANVVMLNLAPKSIKEKYIIYDNKHGVDENSQQAYKNIEETIYNLGMNICVSQGNFKDISEKLI